MLITGKETEWQSTAVIATPDLLQSLKAESAPANKVVPAVFEKQFEVFVAPRSGARRLAGG
jgi:hypothetical protein